MLWPSLATKPQRNLDGRNNIRESKRLCQVIVIFFYFIILLHLRPSPQSPHTISNSSKIRLYFQVFSFDLHLWRNVIPNLTANEPFLFYMGKKLERSVIIVFDRSTESRCPVIQRGLRHDDSAMVASVFLEAPLLLYQRSSFLFKQDGLLSWCPLVIKSSGNWHYFSAS